MPVRAGDIRSRAAAFSDAGQVHIALISKHSRPSNEPVRELTLPKCSSAVERDASLMTLVGDQGCAARGEQMQSVAESAVPLRRVAGQASGAVASKRMAKQ